MSSISMPFSRLLSLLTLAYGVFALVRPSHLAEGLEAPRSERRGFERLAYTYAGRDLAVSGLGVAAPSPQLVTTAMGLRLAGDLSDAAILGLTSQGRGRAKALAATLGWATLNAAALATDLTRRGR